MSKQIQDVVAQLADLAERLNATLKEDQFWAWTFRCSICEENHLSEKCPHVAGAVYANGTQTCEILVEFPQKGVYVTVCPACGERHR